MAAGGREPEERIVFDTGMVRGAIAELTTASSTRLSAVSVGTPHASAEEIALLAGLASGQASQVPFYINTGRDVLGRADEAGDVATLERFGATFVTDTCTYITPIMEDRPGVVMTNSGKWAYYAPANLGVEVILAGVEDCVESAVAGRVIVGEW
jgi:predicted aconitase